MTMLVRGAGQSRSSWHVYKNNIQSPPSGEEEAIIVLPQYALQLSTPAKVPPLDFLQNGQLQHQFPRSSHRLGAAVSAGNGGSSIGPLYSFRPIEGMLVLWAPNLDNLLLEDSLCTVHGRFIVCGGPTENVADPEWEISSFMCFP
jgi:hypothetical protein